MKMCDQAVFCFLTATEKYIIIIIIIIVIIIIIIIIIYYYYIIIFLFQVNENGIFLL